MLYCRNRRNLTYVHWHQNRSRSNSSLNDITLIHWSLKSIQKQSFFFENPWLEMTTTSMIKRNHIPPSFQWGCQYITSVTKVMSKHNRKQQVRNIIGGIHRLLNHIIWFIRKWIFKTSPTSEPVSMNYFHGSMFGEESRRKKGFKDTFLKTKWCFINCFASKSQTNISWAPKSPLDGGVFGPLELNRAQLEGLQEVALWLGSPLSGNDYER